MAHDFSMEAEEWFYMFDGELCGPCDFRELQDLVDRGRVMKKAMVWTEGMDHWVSADQVEELVWAGEAPKEKLDFSPKAKEKLRKEKEMAEEERLNRLRAREVAVTTRQWLWVFFIALIPVVNFVVLMNWAFGDNETPRSKASWARATLLAGLLGLLLGLGWYLGPLRQRVR